MKISELKEAIDIVYEHMKRVGLEHNEVRVRTYHETGRPGTRIGGITINGNKPELIIVAKSNKKQ